jgi:hypothetical protein
VQIDRLRNRLADPLHYLAGAAAYVAAPVVLVMVAARPRTAVIADMIWPTDPDRRLAAVATRDPPPLSFASPRSASCSGV